MHTNTTPQVDTTCPRHHGYSNGLVQAIGDAMRADAERSAIVAVPGHGTATSPWLLSYAGDADHARRWELSRYSGQRWANVLSFGDSLDAAAAFMQSYDRAQPPATVVQLPLWPTAAAAASPLARAA